MFYMVMAPLSIAMARNNGNVSWRHMHVGEDLVKADGEYCVCDSPYMCESECVLVYVCVCVGVMC